MILPFYYWYFQSALSPELCDRILEIGVNTIYDRKEKFGADAVSGSVGGWHQKSTRAENAVPINEKPVDEFKDAGGDLSNAYVRDSEVAFFTFPELYDIIWPFINEANAKAGWNFDWDYTEDFQFTKYSVGQFYGWHTDSSDRPFMQFDPLIHPYHKNPDGTPYIDQYGEMNPEDHSHTINPKLIGNIRKLSCTITLNDPNEYDGGDLRFDLGPHRTDRYHTCEGIRPRGSIVVFPSHVHHQVTPVTRGTRYSLVCWNVGKPFR